MAPKGIPRPLFSELVAKDGAYIIVSGGDNASDSAWNDRVDAMTKAIASVPGANRLHLDFYGSHKLAQWINRHPGVALWVRDAIKQPLDGWKPFGDWSAHPKKAGKDDDYALDDVGRMIDGTRPDRPTLPVIEGINRMREVLAFPGRSVRLVGLSGMGKTRLAQALFDERIGINALDPKRAVYADIGDDLIPTPREALVRLAHEAQSVVLIIDNCPPALHGKLVKELNAITTAKLSLLTIEYDVADDAPRDGTATFDLEPASDAVIERLI